MATMTDPSDVAAAVSLAARLLTAAIGRHVPRRAPAGPPPRPAARRRRRPRRCCSPSPTRCCARPTPARAMAPAARPRRARPAAAPCRSLDRIGLRLAAAGSRLAPRPGRGDRAAAHPGRDARRHRRRRRSGVRPLRAAPARRRLRPQRQPARRGDPRRRRGGRPRSTPCCARIERPDVDYVSVKISALCAGLDVLAFDHELAPHRRPPARRLRRRPRRSDPPVFVNLDMEEYRDLHLTVDAFTTRARRAAVPRPARRDRPAGVPARHPRRRSTTSLAWVADRHGAGGAPVKVRLVKGANLAMEHVDAELGGWTPAPYATKAEVDASYKALLDRLLDAAAGGGLHVGVASHNLFDVAWALGEIRRRGLGRPGRDRDARGDGAAAGPGRRATRPAPCCSTRRSSPTRTSPRASPTSSRRLDENSGPENFLRSLFTIAPGSPAWDAERRRFEQAVADRARVHRTPRRGQDRATEQRTFDPDAPFANEPDTDFTQAANRAWIAAHLARRPAGRAAAAAHDDGRRSTTSSRGPGAAPRRGRRRRRPSAAPRCAASPRRWPPSRGRTIAVMAHETGKTVREGDPEVSEAIDFARWAAACTRELDDLAADGVAADPLGVVLVAGPWNFPTAIPANGVARRARRRQRGDPQAGAGGRGDGRRARPPRPRGRGPRRRRAARALPRRRHRPPPRHPRRRRRRRAHRPYDTARLFLVWRPDLHLLAETSGKNALVDQPDRRRRPRPARPRALGVRPRRPEVLGRLAGHRRGAAVRRPGVPRPPRRRRAHAPRRAGHRPGLGDGTRHRPAGRAAAAGPDDARPRRALARRAAPARRQRPPVVARRADRRAARLVVPPHRVLRAGARRHPRRRPRPRARASRTPSPSG